MINCADMFVGNDNPALKMTTHATEKLTEATFNTVSAFADNVLKFNQNLSKCKTPQDAFTALSNLAQENAATAMSATQKSCTAMLESFSQIGGQCASAMEATAETFNDISPVHLKAEKTKKTRD